MRPGRRLGMELHGAYFLGAMADSSHCSIIEVPMGDFEIGRQALFLHCIAMILRSNKYPPGAQILNRLVGATMSKFQLEGRCTKGERKNLVA